jgi:hypothetical protein
MMTDIEMIRCPSCKGMKQVPKLGGMIGECNTCKGVGKINASEQKVIKIALTEEHVGIIISQVSDCVPVSNIEHKASIETLPISEPIKVDGKRAIYKRKTTA